ncbi:MAG: alpha-hydroxy-acid oxidizing protein, partial [Burkholderiales bacterium]
VDVIKAIALGATACMIGRAWLYGLAAGGESGVDRALGILRDEIDMALALSGCASLSEVNRNLLAN